MTMGHWFTTVPLANGMLNAEEPQTNICCKNTCGQEINFPLNIRKKFKEVKSSQFCYNNANFLVSFKVNPKIPFQNT